MDDIYHAEADTDSVGRAYLDVLTKGPGGEKSVERHRPEDDPYCYIGEEDLSMHECRRYGVRPSPDAPEGYLKIEADSMWDVRDYDEATTHRTYEADVNLAARVMVDESWGVARPDPEDVLYFDIEVDDRGAFSEPEDADGRILSIAAVDGAGGEFYRDAQSETSIAMDFLEFAEDYLVLAAWNGLGYDFPYLENRFKLLGVTPDWSRWERLDLMPLYDGLARPTETVDTNLEATGQRELGHGKTDVSAGDGELYRLWDEGDPRMREYNIRDCTVMREVDEKFGIIDLLHVVCDICGIPPADTCYQSKHGKVRFAPGQAVDAHILSTARDRGVPMPNKGRFDTGDFPGADVLDPEPGFHDNVATLDYSGMYPNIVRAFNFGPTTWYEDVGSLRGEHPDAEYIIGESGVFLHHDEKRSVMAEAVDDLVEFREGAPDIVDRGVKVINNTLYGVSATPYHRYYLPGMSENITLIGQRLVRLAETGAEECEHVGGVVYGDTDSVMVQLAAGADEDPRLLVDMAAEAVDVTESVLREWARDRNAAGEYLKLDIDDVYRKFFLSDKKKRYFGHRLWSDAWSNEVKITGLEYKQSDVPRPAREMQRELIDARLFGGGTTPIIEEYRETLRSGEWDTAMATKKGLGKPPDEYEAATPPVHARAAMAIREKYGDGVAGVGSKVGYIKYGPKTSQWTWVHDGEMGRDLHHHHYTYLWDEKFEGVMESVGVSEHDQTSLGAFAQ